jgi:RimJ/RimL family protein N-acetyltransferase
MINRWITPPYSSINYPSFFRAFFEQHQFKCPSPINIACIQQSLQLQVTITTPRLTIASIGPSDKEFFRKLHVDNLHENMQYYAKGRTWTAKEMEEEFSEQIKRWEAGKALSGFIIHTRGKLQTKAGDLVGPIGYIILKNYIPPEDEDIQNTASLAYILDETAWHYGLAHEANFAIVQHYTPFLKEKGWFTREDDATGTLMDGVSASVNPDNPASIRVLLGVGMDIYSIENTPIAVQDLGILESPKAFKPRSLQLPEKNCDRIYFFASIKALGDPESLSPTRLPNALTLSK